MVDALVTAAIAAVVAIAVAGCSERVERGVTAPTPPPLPDPLLPVAAGAHAPAHTVVDGDATGLGRSLADVESCSSCHPDVFAHQQASAHAWSSFNNPVYRYSVDEVRAAVGRPASRMCAGCHDVALLVGGAMDGEIVAADPRAHAGVTCRTCHGIAAARRDGNGSFTLRATPIPLPREGDKGSVRRHKIAAAPLRSDQMCGSCHRGFLGRETGNGHFLPGMDELTGHADSAYAGAGLSRIDEVEPASCIDCHMRPEAAELGDAAAGEDGMIASHRFAGGHTWLAAMLGDRDQLAAHRAMLEGAATIDIAGARVGEHRSLPADGAAIAPGDEVVIDVVIRNTRVGHRFPAGVLDAQDTFVAIEVADARGRAVAGDRGAHVLRALVADQDGAPRYARDVHNFRAVVVNHTVAPRDAQVVRYRFAVPERARLPLTLTAELIHRSRNRTVGKLACAATRDRRGRAFARAARAAGRPVLDACAAQPETVIAEARAGLGEGAPARTDRDRAARLYELGMALSHTVQEQLDEARAPLTRALEIIGADPARARDRARVMAMLAVVSGRQGRTAEALDWAGRAEAEIGAHPALAKIRGDALARVWRWDEAARSLGPAVAGAPGNRAGWRAYGIALGSLGRQRDALEASLRGLALSPRDPDLLRVQALALRALGAPDAIADAALDAFDHHRRPDRAADIRIDCARSIPACALERQPVHVHELAPIPVR